MIAIVFGTRPEIIKVEPVIAELEKRRIKTLLIHTGQHNLKSLLKDLKIRRPDYVLDLPPESAGKFKGSLVKGLFNALYWSFKATAAIRRVLSKEKPDALLYEGDTLAIASASIAGRLFLKRSLLCHIEAGLRTDDILNPFPEEIARRIADRTSDLLFAPTSEARRNMESDMFVRGKIFVTGNTIVDAVLRHKEFARRKKLNLPKRFAVAFIHRQENVHFKSNLLNLYSLLSNMEDKIIMIEHPTLMKKLEDFGLIERFKNLKNVEFNPFYDYLPFLKVLGSAQYIVTDSGGIQEEVCSLKVPCLVWRKKTERMEAVRAGAAVLVGDDWRLALRYINEVKKRIGFYKRVKNSANPFGDGSASKRIVDIIEKELGRRK